MEKKIKILFLTHRSSIVGGGEISLGELISSLDKKRFQPYLVTGKSEELQKLYKSAGAEFFFLELPSITAGNLGKIAVTLYKLIKFLKNNRIDLIHANTSRAMFYGGIAGRLIGLPVVWHVRIADKDFPLDIINSSLATKLISISEFVKKRFPESLFSKIEVIPNSVRIEKSKALTPLNHRIINIGQFIPQKNQGCFIRLAEEMSPEFPDLSFELYGKKIPGHEAYFEKLEGMIKKLQERKIKIRLYEFLNDRAKLYENTILLVHTALNEGFGRSIIEAMASGIPVVAISHGAVPEIIKDGYNGFLVGKRNFSELREKVSMLFKDITLRNKFIGNGKITIEKCFSSERLSIIYENLFKQLVT